MEQTTHKGLKIVVTRHTKRLFPFEHKFSIYWHFVESALSNYEIKISDATAHIEQTQVKIDSDGICTFDNEAVVPPRGEMRAIFDIEIYKPIYEEKAVLYKYVPYNDIGMFGDIIRKTRLVKVKNIVNDEDYDVYGSDDNYKIEYEDVLVRHKIIENKKFDGVIPYELPYQESKYRLYKTLGRFIKSVRFVLYNDNEKPWINIDNCHYYLPSYVDFSNIEVPVGALTKIESSLFENEIFRRRNFAARRVSIRRLKLCSFPRIIYRHRMFKKKLLRY